MKAEMEKMEGKSLDIILSHRAGVSLKDGLVLLQLSLDGYAEPLNIALPPDQARAVSSSLLLSLARLQPIQ